MFLSKKYGNHVCIPSLYVCFTLNLSHTLALLVFPVCLHQFCLCGEFGILTGVGVWMCVYVLACTSVWWDWWRIGKIGWEEGGEQWLNEGKTAETDGCSITTCRRGNKRAFTLVKAGDQGEKLTEMRWGGKTENIDRSAYICFVVWAVWISIKAFESILALKQPPFYKQMVRPADMEHVCKKWREFRYFRNMCIFTAFTHENAWMLEMTKITILSQHSNSEQLLLLDR